MATDEELTILKHGARKWNDWRLTSGVAVPDFSGADLASANLSSRNLRQAIFRRANLSGAKLNRSILKEAILSEANCSGANLSRSNFARARLRSTNLRNADLRNANLYYADLSHSILDGANLHGADLRGVDFSGASLIGVDLTIAVAGFTQFADCNLGKAQGLESIQHLAPSSVGIDTIYISSGDIPEGFLRGCGVPDNLIRYIPSLLQSEEAAQYYSCFISYSSKDEKFARSLHSKMRDAHLRVWFAPEDIQGGKKLHEQIEAAIRGYDKLLIVLSEASLQSEWVMDELRKGFKAERQSGKRKLFPVRLADYETLERWECRDSIGGKDLAEEVRQYFIPDFSHWKEHDSFESGFARLLKDLRAEEGAK